MTRCSLGVLPAAVLLVAAAAGQELTTVRGRVETWTGEYGASPLPLVPVALLAPGSDEPLSSDITDEGGMFRFPGVMPGHYLLEVRPQGRRHRAFAREFDAGTRAYTDLPPVLMHDFRFDFPREDSVPVPDSGFTARGTCRDLPDWPVALMFRLESDSFLRRFRDVGIIVESDSGGIWEAELEMPGRARTLFAVLLTREARAALESDEAGGTAVLPRDARVLAAAPLTNSE